MNIALITEAGVRRMALKNVSLDVAFRYRLCRPNYHLKLEGETISHTVTIPQNVFNALLRVSYHF